MGLVPTDYPQRLAARGLTVHAFSDWADKGSSADHGAVVIHHTASSSSTRPEDDAAYCHHGGSDAPLYNVLVDRYGEVWLLARRKANSSGSISSTALEEALEGRAGSTSAGARGLEDDTSANASLFSIAAQNNGTGEWWSEELLDGLAVCTAVALEGLELAHAGYVTQHRVLTARKIDPTGPGCPLDWEPRVTAALEGDEMPLSDADLEKIRSICHDELVRVWRAEEMQTLDIARANSGSHDSTLSIVRGAEYGAIVTGCVEDALDAFATDLARSRRHRHDD